MTQEQLELLLLYIDAKLNILEVSSQVSKLNWGAYDDAQAIKRHLFETIAGEQH